jgi:hypothetical protein
MASGGRRTQVVTDDAVDLPEPPAHAENLGPAPRLAGPLRVLEVEHPHPPLRLRLDGDSRPGQ